MSEEANFIKNANPEKLWPQCYEIKGYLQTKSEKAV